MSNLPTTNEPVYFPFDAADGTAITYVVMLPCASVDGELSPCLTDVARAERAAVLAALNDGHTTPAILRFARKSLGYYDQTGLAIALSVPQLAVEEWEAGDRAIDDITRSEFITLLRQSDRGGFVAKRVPT